MARNHIIALAAFAALAATGTAAHADDITIADEIVAFQSTKSRAEVCDEVLAARTAGIVSFTSEVDLSSTMAAAPASALTREQVRAEVGDAARRHVMLWYPA
jgi:hypothetical protein